MEVITTSIKAHKEINKELVEIYDVGRYGNCFYRTLSIYFTNVENFYSFFREQIYIAAKNNLNELKEFFILDTEDPILVNDELEEYLEKIKENKCFAGNIEINIAAKIFNVNIAVYEKPNFDSNYIPY